MIELEFVPADSTIRRPKATVHKTGKLGFNKDAAKVLGLQKGMQYHVGLNRASSDDNNLYLVECVRGDKGCAVVLKAGDYFYLNLTSVFAKMGFDYRRLKAIYDVETGKEYEGTPMVVLRSRGEPVSRS